MSNIKFKYQPINESGQATGWFPKKGELRDETLQLDGESFSIESILHTVLIENVFVFTIPVPGDVDNFRAVSILIKAGAPGAIKVEVDRIRSKAHIAAAELNWQKNGGIGAFRKEICPNCQASLDLSRFEKTPQLYCDYCDTIYTVPQAAETPKNESAYRLCEHCGMYSKPRPFTEFYFYFLFVVYGVWSQKSMRCPACMRSTAWKMLGLNFIFVLGIIPAIYQLIRAYGSDKIAGPFAGLHGANLKATRRNYSAATKTYQAILERVPVAAGVHYNLGLALTQNKEWERASAAFELALADCSNYRYAAGGLIHCYENLDRQQDIEALRACWQESELTHQES